MPVFSLPDFEDVEIFNSLELEKFRKSQRFAFECATEIEKELKVGMTEKEAAKLMRQWCAKRGVKQFFHAPFVWFGDRTGFCNHQKLTDFLPTNRKLEENMAVILDVAPIVEGYTSDIGYSCFIGESTRHEKMVMDLQPFRSLILEGILAERTLKSIYEEVDTFLKDKGYENAHYTYPGHVLAHRISRINPNTRFNPTILGLGMKTFSWLQQGIKKAKSAGDISPLWNASKHSDVVPTPGLWSVEPHLRKFDMGVKWEEMLVIDESGAYWLDDQTPHMARWSGRNSTAS